MLWLKPTSSEATDLDRQWQLEHELRHVERRRRLGWGCSSESLQQLPSLSSWCETAMQLRLSGCGWTSMRRYGYCWR